MTCPVPTPQGLADSRVLQDGDDEGGAVRRSARTRRPPELYGDSVPDAVFDEELKQDTEVSVLDLFVGFCGR